MLDLGGAIGMRCSSSLVNQFTVQGIDAVCKDGKAVSKPWRLRPLRRIALAIDAPLVARDATPAALQEKVLALRGDWR